MEILNVQCICQLIQAGRQTQGNAKNQKQSIVQEPIGYGPAETKLPPQNTLDPTCTAIFHAASSINAFRRKL